MQINRVACRNAACSRPTDKKIRDYIALNCNPLPGITPYRLAEGVLPTGTLAPWDKVAVTNYVDRFLANR